MISRQAGSKPRNKVTLKHPLKGLTKHRYQAIMENYGEEEEGRNINFGIPVVKSISINLRGTISQRCLALFDHHMISYVLPYNFNLQVGFSQGSTISFCFLDTGGMINKMDPCTASRNV